MKTHLANPPSLFAACGRLGSIVRDGRYVGGKETTVIENVTCLDCLHKAGRAVRRRSDRKLEVIAA